MIQKDNGTTINYDLKKDRGTDHISISLPAELTDTSADIRLEWYENDPRFIESPVAHITLYAPCVAGKDSDGDDETCSLGEMDQSAITFFRCNQ